MRLLRYARNVSLSIVSSTWLLSLACDHHPDHGISFQKADPKQAENNRSWLAEVASSTNGSLNGSLSYEEITLSIPKQSLETQVFGFGIICTGGTQCQAGQSQSSTRLVRLTRVDEHLLLLPEDHTPSHGPHYEPLARWHIAHEDAQFLYVVPAVDGLSVLQKLDSVQMRDSAMVFDRFFHDFRQSAAGIWFHETLRYEYQAYDLAALIRGEDATVTVKQAADTLSIYLIDSPFDASFVEKLPRKDLGFFVSADDFSDTMIYRDGVTFNPEQHKAILWGDDRVVEWVVNRDVPDAIYPLIVDGILRWQPHLPSHIQLRVRKAEVGEELDSPFINSFIYTVSPSLGGVANFSYSRKSGEIFRANIHVSGPASPTETITIDRSAELKPSLTLGYGSITLETHCDLSTQASNINDTTEILQSQQQVENAIRGVVAHEVGHTLGLRHNFRGSHFDQDMSRYPAGSSVMEYPNNFDSLRIGPYDQEAVAWGYQDVEPQGGYEFCTDENAGFLTFFAGSNPGCHRYDLTHAAPFNYYHPRLLQLFEVGLTNGVDRIDDVSLSHLSMVTPYHRDPADVYFDASKADAVLQLFTAVGNFPAPTSATTDRLMWTATGFLFDNLAAVLEDHLSYETLYASRDAVMDALGWVASHGTQSDAAFQSRRHLVESISSWKDEVYGAPFVTYLRHQLEASASPGDDRLALENRLLLRLLEEN